MDNATKLSYMEDSYKLEGTSSIVDITKDEKGNDVMILDQTYFYPQGGGQPFDQGTIYKDNAQMIVSEVRFNEGKVLHIGKIMSGSFGKMDTVFFKIDGERRAVNRRNHTAGHLIDIAMKTVGNFTPIKGFHFPQGAYVEYQGIVDEAKKEEMRSTLENKIDNLIESSLPVVTRFVQKNELAKYCDFVPEWLPSDKPIRLVTIGDYKGHPCGGTHVKNTSEIKKLIIEKIANKKGNTRISYKITS